MTGERYDRALAFAKEAHKDVKRKTSDIPYIVHPIETAQIASGLTDDEDVIIAALLHDVVEDTGYTADDIRELFGDRVAELVSEETENKRRYMNPSDSWKIRKQETIEHLKKASRDTKIIALADKLSNMRATKNDFDRLGDSMWQCFNQKDPKEHGWYYKSITNALSELSSTEEWKELKELCDYVFK